METHGLQGVGGHLLRIGPTFLGYTSGCLTKEVQGPHAVDILHGFHALRMESYSLRTGAVDSRYDFDSLSSSLTPPLCWGSGGGSCPQVMSTS